MKERERRRRESTQLSIRKLRPKKAVQQRIDEPDKGEDGRDGGEEGTAKNWIISKQATPRRAHIDNIHVETAIEDVDDCDFSLRTS